MISSRRFQGPEDVQMLLDFAAAVRPAERRADYPGQTDLRELLAQVGIRARTRLWIDGRDRLLAYAFVDDFNNLCFDVDPSRLDSLGTELAAWGEAGLREGLKPGETGSLDASCREADSERIAFLENLGFQTSSERTLHFIRLLAEAAAEPGLPKGFVIRPVKGVEEAEALAALHRAAFGTDYLTADLRRGWMTEPDYDPALDLTAVAPDGTLAAYCLCQVHPDQNASRGVKEGFTDPVAVHPRFQRLGLARALLLTGMNLLRVRGLHAARLATADSNTAMRKAAEAAGFHVEHTSLWFHKPVAAAEG